MWFGMCWRNMLMLLRNPTWTCVPHVYPILRIKDQGFFHCWFLQTTTRLGPIHISVCKSSSRWWFTQDLDWILRYLRFKRCLFLSYTIYKLLLILFMFPHILIKSFEDIITELLLIFNFLPNPFSIFGEHRFSLRI